MTDPTHPDRALARIARSQHGLVSTAQAKGAGVSPKAVRRRLRTGALVRAGAHVMATSFVSRNWEQAALAACLDAGRGAVLSHRSAATAWQLDVPRSPRIEVTLGYGRSARTARVTVHRSRTLTAADCAVVGRLPVTSIPRTLVDLAEVLGPSRLAAVADDALARRLVTPVRLEQTATRLKNGRSSRTAVLRAVARTWSESPAMDSVAEAAFLRTVLAAGLPPPATQLPVILPDGPTVRLDFAWPERMVAVEVDGFRWHANPASHAGDSTRANLLASAGWEVLRTTPAELASPRPPVLAALRRRLVGIGGGSGLPLPRSARQRR